MAENLNMDHRFIRTYLQLDSSWHKNIPISIDLFRLYYETGVGDLIYKEGHYIKGMGNTKKATKPANGTMTVHTHLQGTLREFDPHMPDETYKREIGMYKSGQDNTTRGKTRTTKHLTNNHKFKAPFLPDVTTTDSTGRTITNIMLLHPVNDLQLCLNCQSESWFDVLEARIPRAVHGEFWNLLDKIRSTVSMTLAVDNTAILKSPVLKKAVDQGRQRNEVEIPDNATMDIPLKTISLAEKTLLDNYFRYDDVVEEKPLTYLKKRPFFQHNGSEKLYFEWKEWGFPQQWEENHPRGNPKRDKYDNLLTKRIGLSRTNVYTGIDEIEKLSDEDNIHHIKLYYFDRYFTPNNFMNLYGQCIVHMYGLSNPEGQQEAGGLCGFIGWKPEFQNEQTLTDSVTQVERFLLTAYNNAAWHGPPGCSIDVLSRVNRVSDVVSNSYFDLSGMDNLFEELFKKHGTYMMVRALRDIFDHNQKLVADFQKNGPVVWLYNIGGETGYRVYYRLGFRRILDLRGILAQHPHPEWVWNHEGFKLQNKETLQKQFSLCKPSDCVKMPDVKEKLGRLDDNGKQFWNYVIPVERLQGDQDVAFPKNKHGQGDKDLCNGLMILTAPYLAINEDDDTPAYEEKYNDVSMALALQVKEYMEDYDADGKELPFLIDDQRKQKKKRKREEEVADAGKKTPTWLKRYGMFAIYVRDELLLPLFTNPRKQVQQLRYNTAVQKKRQTPPLMGSRYHKNVNAAAPRLRSHAPTKEHELAITKAYLIRRDGTAGWLKYLREEKGDTVAADAYVAELVSKGEPPAGLDPVDIPIAMQTVIPKRRQRSMSTRRRRRKSRSRNTRTKAKRKSASSKGYRSRR